MASEFCPTHSSSGLYGGMARSMSENEIFRTMTKGTTKNSKSHRYGSVTTRPRPEMPILENGFRRLIESSCDDHGAGGIPRQIHLLIPRDRLGVARGVRLRHPHHLAGGELDQVNRQVAQVGDVLDRAANHVVGAVCGAAAVDLGR